MPDEAVRAPILLRMANSWWVGMEPACCGYRGVDAAGRLRSRLAVKSASSVARATAASTVCQAGPAEATLDTR